MIIIIVHWRIRREGRDAFFEHWKTKNVIADRSGLIAEVLTQQLSPREFAQAAWDLEDEPGDHESFYTIGLWQSLADFENQVARFMRASHPFEQAPRRRAVLDPALWRSGAATFPPDPAGVV